MSIPPKILSAIQHAGQAIYNTQRELATIASERSRKVHKALASEAFAAEADTFFQEWKMSVKLAQELKEINERLAAMYAAASGLSSATSGAKSGRGKKRAKAAPAAASGARTEPVIRGNNAKLLKLLQSLLNRDGHTAVTQAQMAEGAAIPLGSVAYSVGRLISMGQIEEGPARGTYKLI
jgi:hypothetical protein